MVKEVRELGRSTAGAPYFAPQPAPGCPEFDPPGWLEFATFRAFHPLGPGSAGVEPRPSARPVRPTPAKFAARAPLWRDELATGAVPSRAALARREGLSRARITHILRPTATDQTPAWNSQAGPD